MLITYDPIKRQATLEERNVDFEWASEIFAGKTVSKQDNRFDYGEERIVTAGYRHDRMMIVIWTPRENARHIISMRKANAREQRFYSTLFTK